MHAIFDFVEILLPEYMDPKELEELNREIYRVDTLNSRGELVAVPAGFDRDAEMASFDAFAEVAGK